MTFIPSVTGDKTTQFEFDINTYGAVGDGTTNDRPALVLALAAAVAAGGVVKFSKGTYRISTSITLTQPCVFDIGATIKPSSGQVITFNDTIIAEAKPIFDRSASGTFLIYPMKQGDVYPEWWGAKTMLSSSVVTLDADTIDCAPAFNAMFSSFYGGANFTACRVIMSGWYAVSAELRLSAVGLDLVGRSPVWNGTGFKWIGTVSNTSSILHLSGCEFASIRNVGFKAPRSLSESTRLLAAIRVSYVPGTATQRGITIENILIGDPLGHFVDINCAHEFSAGILEGGPDYQFGNDDFHTVKNLFFAWCKDGIRIESNQAVEWMIENYRATYCDTMFHSLTGCQFYGYRWYAASTSWECVIKNSSANLLAFDLRGMSCEHLVANAFVKSVGYVKGNVSGYLLQKSKNQRWSNVSVTANVATCSDPITTFTSMFFTSSMVGQQLLWRTGDTGQKAIITAVNSPTSANVTVSLQPAWVTATGTYVIGDRVSNSGVNYVCILGINNSTTAPASDPTHWTATSLTSVNNGQVTATNADGVNEFRLVDCDAGIVSMDFSDLTFGITEDVGSSYPEYKTADTRMTFNFGASNSELTRNVGFYNCHNAFQAYLYDNEAASHNSVFDFSWINCIDSSGSTSYPNTICHRYSRGTVDAQHFTPLENMRSAASASSGVVDAISVGEKRGGLTNELRTKTRRVVSGSYPHIFVDGFFTPDKLYFGCSIFIRLYDNFGSNVFHAVKVGTPDLPELFGRAPYSTTEYISRANSAYQMPVSFTVATALQLTLIYVSTNIGTTVSQSGTTVTASGSIFAVTDIGRELKWLTGAQAGDATYITDFASGTSVTVSDSKTRASGTFELERSMTAGAGVLVQPLFVQFLPNTAEHMIDRFNAITAESKTYNMIPDNTEAFSHANWAGSELTFDLNVGSAPYGTADKCIPTATNTYHPVQRSISGSTVGVPHTTSIIAKAAGYNHIMIYGYGAASGRYFNVSTGVIGSAFGAAPLASGREDLGNGYWRCWITELTNGSGGGTVGFYICSADGTASFAGDTTSGVQLFGAQVTEGYGLKEYGTTYKAIIPSATKATALTQFKGTTSAQLAATISDETGTGLAVFNNGPTFIGPILGTPASGVATNLTGTAAGLTAGNVTTNANLTGHVTSTGNAAVLGSFTKTQLDTAISDGNVVYVGDALNGTVGATTPATGAFTTITGTTLSLTSGKVGGTLFNSYTDTSTTSTNGTEDDLYSYTTAANTLDTDGDNILQTEYVQFVSSATAARRLKKYFAGTLIFDSGSLTLTLGGDFYLETMVIRESSTVVRVSVNVVAVSASAIPYATYTRITGLTLSNTNIIKTTGIASGTGAASGDIIDKLSKIIKQPAA